MAIYFPTKVVSGSGASKVNVPGQIIQIVDNTQTISTTVTTAAWVDVLSTSITINETSNKIMVEYFMNDRSDQGNGTWSLIYHRILRNGTQVMYSGYNGAAANYIGYYARTFLDSPGAGTWTYTASVLAHQGTAWIGNYNSGSVAHYLRLYEIGA
jgi:hypothetical protein